MKLSAAGVLLDPDLPRAGRRDLDVLVGQDLGPAVFVYAHCCDHDDLLQQVLGALHATGTPRAWVPGDEVARARIIGERHERRSQIGLAAVPIIAAGVPADCA